MERYLNTLFLLSRYLGFWFPKSPNFFCKIVAIIGICGLILIGLLAIIVKFVKSSPNNNHVVFLILDTTIIVLMMVANVSYILIPTFIYPNSHQDFIKILTENNNLSMQINPNDYFTVYFEFILIHISIIVSLICQIFFYLNSTKNNNLNIWTEYLAIFVYDYLLAVFCMQIYHCAALIKRIFVSFNVELAAKQHRVDLNRFLSNFKQYLDLIDQFNQVYGLQILFTFAAILVVLVRSIQLIIHTASSYDDQYDFIAFLAPKLFDCIFATASILY